MFHLWKRTLQKLARNKSYQNVRDLCHYASKYRGASHSTCIVKFSVPNYISVVFHSDSNYDYHFIIKESANKFDVTFECLGKMQKSTKRFLFNRKRSYKIHKDGNESVATISCKIKCIDSLRFTATSLSNFVDNLREGIHKIKFKDCNCFLEYESVKDNLIKYKRLSCNKRC